MERNRNGRATPTRNGAAQPEGRAKQRAFTIGALESGDALIRRPPFAAPHHDASTASLVAVGSRSTAISPRTEPSLQKRQPRYGVR